MATAEVRQARRSSWLRVLARRRSLRVAVVLLLPLLLVVALDVAMRGERLLAFPPKYAGSYLGAMLESALFWGLLLWCASGRRGRLRWLAGGVFVTLATLVLGTQLYFYRQYSTYLNLDATLFGTSVTESVFGQLEADGAHFAGSILPPLAVALCLVWLGRALVRPRRRDVRRASLLIPAAIAGALLIPCSYRSIQGSTPDVLYFHAIGGVLQNVLGVSKRPTVRPMRRTPPALPRLTARPAVARNVLFILTESVRADVACSAHRASCPVTPFTNAALPRRLPLEQMRASSSTTAIQLAVLWSGLAPNAGREPLHTAPLLFDYAHAAGFETAYWSSHHMMFANSRLYVQDLPTRFQCGATQLDPLADIDLGADDRLLTARVIEQVGQLREPFFAVAHYGNTHVPYRVEPADAPFQPSLPSKSQGDNEAYRNYFKNAVYTQDRTIAELIRHVRGQPFGERTVIVFTSDHGEQFREHGQIGHTCSLFDVELHVPTWIDAPEGLLTSAERAALGGYTRAPTSHADFAPTLLDLMGLWDAPELERYRRAMVGGSLLRPGRAEVTLALTNCSGVWGCALANWGVMRGTRKLVAREWDRDWLCYDVATDPAELNPLDLASCQDLVAEATRTFGTLPGR